MGYPLLRYELVGETSLLNGGTLYPMGVHPTSWNVFPYTIRSTPYPMGKGTLYPIREEYVVPPTPWGGVHHIPWGGVHPTPWWGYHTPWGGVFPNPIVRGKGYPLYFSHYREVRETKYHTNPFLTYQLKLVMLRTRSKTFNESSITCKSHDHESLLFIELTSKT